MQVPVVLQRPHLENTCGFCVWRETGRRGERDRERDREKERERQTERER